MITGPVSEQFGKGTLTAGGKNPINLELRLQNTMTNKAKVFSPPTPHAFVRKTARLRVVTVHNPHPCFTDGRQFLN